MRVNIRAILADPAQRQEMCVRAILFMQAMEGIETTREQAIAAYRKIQEEKSDTMERVQESGPPHH
jgi:hypothetical protein